VASGCLCVAGFSGAIAKASKDPLLGRASGVLGDFIGKLQGLVTVPFWEYKGHHLIVAIIDHISNGWVM